MSVCFVFYEECQWKPWNNSRVDNHGADDHEVDNPEGTQSWLGFFSDFSRMLGEKPKTCIFIYVITEF